MISMGNNYVSGIWLQINLGLFVGLGLAGAAGTILTPMISNIFQMKIEVKQQAT